MMVLMGIVYCRSQDKVELSWSKSKRFQKSWQKRNMVWWTSGFRYSTVIIYIAGHQQQQQQFIVATAM